MKKEHIYSIAFIVAVAAMSVMYDYHTELFERPHGYHNWRQCDGASIALNYYNVSMNFFEPRISLLSGNDGKMVSEFPVIYYAAACLYKIFGVHEFFIRLISVFIFYTGLFCLYKTISLVLTDKFYGLVLSLMMFTSPVIVEYALNFLPDVPALSFSFIGLYCFVNFTHYNNVRMLYLSACCFLFCGLLKVTALIGFASLVVVILVQWRYYSFKNHKPDWLKNTPQLTAFVLIPLIVTVCWVAYAKYYNAVNSNFYFTTAIRPIWNVSEARTKEIWGQFQFQWLRFTMYRDFMNTIPLLAAASILFISRKNMAYVLWMVLCLLGSALYVFSFFEQFYIHDYYLACIAFVPLAVLVTFLRRIKEWSTPLFQSAFFRFLLIALLGIMVHHGYRIHELRKADMEMFSKNDDFNLYYYTEQQLLSAGVLPTDKVISMGDYSTCVSLYLMNRRGFTQYGMSKVATVTDIEQCKTKGAGYLLVPNMADTCLSNESKNIYLQGKKVELPGYKVYSL